MNQTTFKPTRSDPDLEAALLRIDNLMDAVPGTPEFDELEVHAHLAEAYEDDRWPIEMPSPISALVFRMAHGNLTERHLEPYIGDPTPVSAVLAGTKPLTMEMARSLHEHLRIPAEVLLAEPR